MNTVIRKVNSAYYHYRANRWRWHSWFHVPSRRPIDRPIFLIGTQGGGLTLTSRILRRIPGVVSVTGSHKYWAGGDEMQDVVTKLLPRCMAWRDEFRHIDGMTAQRHTWLYATDQLLPAYRGSAEAATESERQKLISLLLRIVNLNASRQNRAPRFIDKSQTFTVRVGLINELLVEAEPRFVLITRDPVAMCWRAVTKVDAFKSLEIPLERKVELAIQHWRNSMSAALCDSESARLRWWRFEDLLTSPAHVVRQICEFADLEFSPSILPQADDHIPWGSAYDAFNRKKWYPLRPDVNAHYLESVPNWARSMISDKCRDLMSLFGYPERSSVNRDCGPSPAKNSTACSRS